MRMAISIVWMVVASTAMHATCADVIVEGYGGDATGANNDPFLCFTGETVRSTWAYARVDGSGGAVAWRSGVVPSNLGDRPVTFVMSCALGGVGGKVFGAPLHVSVNGQHVITITASVPESTQWEQGDVRAAFTVLKRDKWGDPFGLLRITVPASAVTPGGAARLRIEPKITDKAHDNVYFMLNHIGNLLELAEQVGGLDALLGGAVVSLDVARTKRLSQFICLTGNATGELASRNVTIDGRYTYYEGRADAFRMPQAAPWLPRTSQENYDEAGRVGGWIFFADGKLTDADDATRAADRPHLLQGVRGWDVVFDLEDEYLIDGVELVAADNYMRNVEVYLKSPGEARWTLVKTINDRKFFAENYYPKLPSPQRLRVEGSARWVRINTNFESAVSGFKEVLIWGRRMEGERPAKQPALINGGRFEIENPKPIAMPEGKTHEAYPIPQSVSLAEGHFTITRDTQLVVLDDASDRTLRTAQVLAADIADEFGPTLTVTRGATAPDTQAIVMHPVRSVAGAGAQGYRLVISPQRIDVIGVDERGVFFATQTLMQLLEHAGDNCRIAAQTIVDWPDTPWRALSAIPTPTAAMIKALARCKVTHYMQHPKPMSEADRTAAVDRFVQIVPLAQFNWAGNPKPEQWIERREGEPLEKMGTARRNPCPSHPDMWASYFKQIDHAATYPGDYININMDEMYQPNNGSRWNVCPRCRARNLSGHELLAETIEKINAYIHSKGKKTLMIDSPFSRRGISHEGDEDNDWTLVPTILAKRGLADDIVVHCWQGRKLSQHLSDLGFTLLLWSGGQLHEPLADLYAGLYTNMEDGPFKPQNVIAMTQSLWSPQRALGGGRVVARALPDFNRLLTGVARPSLRADATFAPIDLQTAANRRLTDDVAFDGKGFADLGPNYDLRAMQPGRQTLGGVPFDVLADGSVMVHNRTYFNRSLPQHVRIEVGAKASSICFLHTLDARTDQNYSIKQELVGHYFMVYADGTYEPFDLKYGVNICNFDGLNTHWDVTPNGKTMSRATLAWKGELGAGNTASLYSAEWVNPHPGKTIDHIVMASTTKPVGVSPILLAATAVAPTGHTSGVKPTDRKMLAETLEPAEPQGRPVNLAPGRMSENEQVWTADSGIRVAFDTPAYNRVRHHAGYYYHSDIQRVLYDNDQAYILNAGAGNCTLTLPTPALLAGVQFIGHYRHEVGTQIDLDPTVMDWQVHVSRDGETFERIAGEIHYVPSEHPPVWVAFGDEPIKAVRIVVSRSGRQYRNAVGLSFVQLFER